MKFIVIQSTIFLALIMFALLLPVGAAFSSDTKTAKIQNYSMDLWKQFRELGWSDLDGTGVNWISYRESYRNRPLMFTTFGNNHRKATLFLGGLHGDESPSVYLAFKLAMFLQANPAYYKNRTIIIAPSVNPDGFLSKVSTRTNGKGVDINRNFPTTDWRVTKKGRYYSGPVAGSESETKFVMALMKRYKPEKIITIHSPLGTFDYDGPSSDLSDIVVLLKKMSKNNGLPLRRCKVFPGSLGNYAGVERNIHTLTLELPSSVSRQAPKYFEQFRSMLLELLEHP